MASQPSHSIRIGHSELSLGVMEATASSCRDEELMARYQNGESAAFAEIYARYSKRIYGFLVRRVGNPDDCAEIFQDAQPRQ